MKLLSAAALLLLCFGSPAAGQEWTVLRSTHTFIGNSLTINVDVDAPGTLRVARGGVGQIVVVSRTHGGVGTSALTGRSDDQLTLTATDADRVEFLVFVPVDVQATVRLPGGGFPESVGDGNAGAYRWQAPQQQRSR